jgi:hypothetical protein
MGLASKPLPALSRSCSRSDNAARLTLIPGGRRINPMSEISDQELLDQLYKYGTIGEASRNPGRRTRQEFGALRAEVLRANRTATIGTVHGVWIIESQQAARMRGEIYYCENCKFCHTEEALFEVDHLVADKNFRGTSSASNVLMNAAVLCTSIEKGDRGCNQSKGSRDAPLPGAGLAYSRPGLDMNCAPLNSRK